ncbi:hypothetical protein ACWY4P_54040 (plasmid) [Streptomyces sp. LZ34]
MPTVAPAPPLLVPTGDARPVEKAAVDGIVDGFEPETFLWIVFHRPDGGARVWYAWTDGGATLGNRVDQLALAAGLDCADWLHIGDRNCQRSTRGRIAIEAYALRPILADVLTGVRAPGDRRDKVLRFIACAAEETGQTPRPGVPRWLGVGPTLLNRK